jgi:hypothetical protein
MVFEDWASRLLAAERMEAGLDRLTGRGGEFAAVLCN